MNDPKQFRHALDVSVAGAMTSPILVATDTLARLQITAPALSTAIVELVGSLDGETWWSLDPAVTLSTAGVTAAAVIAGYRWIRVRVQTAEATPKIVNVTLCTGGYPISLA